MKAIQVTLRIFGGLMGLAGIEHGIGEILQGSRAPGGLFILSWPNSAFFDIMNGEPALTILPNLLITGILAALFSGAYFAIAVFFPGERWSRLGLILLSIPMLLCGAGLFPPVLGLLVGAAAGGRQAGPRWWSRLFPRGVHTAFGKGWSVLVILCSAAWLFMLPGLNILSYFFEIHNDTLLLVTLISALTLLFLTFFSAYSHDVVQEGSSVGERIAMHAAA